MRPLLTFSGVGGLECGVAHSEAGFGLSAAVLLPDRSIPPAVSCFPVVYARSILCPSEPGDARTAGPSTPQIIAYAMICFGRADRFEQVRTSPLKPKSDLSGAPGRFWFSVQHPHSKFRKEREI